MYIPKQETMIGIKIEEAEKHYKATYLGDFCVKDKNDNWANQPVACFYNENPEPPYGHYFGLCIGSHDNKLYIINAESAFSKPISAVVANNGEVVYSRFRHDYRTSEDGSVFIDGGRDYTRSNTNKFVDLIVENGKLKIKENTECTK